MAGYGLIVLALLVFCVSMYRLLLLRWAAGKPSGGGAYLTAQAFSCGVLLFLATAPIILVNATMGLMPAMLAPAVAGIAIYVLVVLGLTVYIKHQLAQDVPVEKAGAWVAVMLAGVLLVGVVIGRDLYVRQQLAREHEAATRTLVSMKPQISADQNAAPLYRQAFTQLSADDRKSMEWMDQQFMKRVPTTQATSEETAEVEEQVVDTRPDLVRAPEFPANQVKTVQLLRQAAAMDQCDWIEDYRTITIMSVFDWLAEMRQSARLLKWHALTEARAGRLQEAMADVAAIRRMGDHVQNPPLVVSSLVQVGINATGISVVQDLLPTMKTAADLGNIPVRSADWGEKAVAGGFRGEQAGTVRTMADTLLNGDSTGMVPVRGSLMVLYRLAMGDGDVRSFERWMHGVANELEAGAFTPRDERSLQQARRSGMLAAILLPSLNRAAEMATRTKATELCFMAGLAAKRYQLEKGSLPKSLDQVVQAGYLKSVPADPFGGKPLLLETKDGEVLIYSVGPNLKDDHGELLGRDKDDLAFKVR